MAGGTVNWELFDVDSGLVPDAVNPSTFPGDGRGRIVVLASTPSAVEGGWASRAAVGIASNWSDRGLRIFLMDLGLEQPSIHELLDLPNGEGVSDAFMFGASVRHIARPALDGAFFFAPAGSPPGDPAEVLGHERWNDLASGFSEVDATLLLFLPTSLPGAEKILSRATDIVFFSGHGESPEEHLGPAAIKMVANVGPSQSSSVAPVPEESGPDESGLESEPAEAGWALPEVGDEEEEVGIEASEAVSPPEDQEDLGFPADPDAGEGSTNEPDLESPGEGRAGSPFDFSGDFELAEGFWDEPASQDEELDPVESETPGEPEGQLDPVAPPQTAAEELPEAPPLSEFGDELTMGSSLNEDDREEIRSGPPDFEPDFVDLGPEKDAPSGDGAFGEDLVHGADFGASPTSEPEGREDPSEAPPPRAERSPEASSGPSSREAPRTPPKRRPPPKKEFPFGVVAAVVLSVGLMVAAVGTAVGYFNVPGLTFLQGIFGEIPDPPLTLAGPQPNEEILRYSLILFTYEEEELTDATEMLHALRARLPDLLFALVPGEEDGLRIYTLMAGPAYDRIEAENLRGPLAEVLTREDPDSWTVHETPRGFYLGERETLAEAEDYLQTFSGQGIYPYILHVTYPDGSEAFEVMAGAYEGVLDARPLQLILRDAGLRDLPLIERRGSLPE